MALSAAFVALVFCFLAFSCHFAFEAGYFCIDKGIKKITA